MTSNLGSDIIQRLTNEAADPHSGYEKMKAAVMEVVGGHFRPEFINRIDETVVFHPLAREQIRGIASIQLELLRGRLRDRELAIEIDDAVMDTLAAIGFDPVYGARPLKRAIQQYLENPLAQEILRGRFLPGDTIKVSMDGDQVRFEK
jgi:ATP-dependent Clp protease ATP-binding subunit ClpB